VNRENYRSKDIQIHTDGSVFGKKLICGQELLRLIQDTTFRKFSDEYKRRLTSGEINSCCSLFVYLFVLFCLFLTYDRKTKAY